MMTGGGWENGSGKASQGVSPMLNDRLSPRTHPSMLCFIMHKKEEAETLYSPLLGDLHEGFADWGWQVCTRGRV